MDNRLKLSALASAAAVMLAGCSENSAPTAADNTTDSTAAAAVLDTSSAKLTESALPETAVPDTVPAGTTTSSGSSDTAAATSAASETAAETTAGTAEVTTAEYTTEATSSETQTTEAKASETAAETPASAASPSPDDILLYLESDGGYITTETEVLNLLIEYNGADENAVWYTGPEYRLDRLDNGQWENIPFVDEMTWTEEIYEISTESSAEINVRLYPDIYTEPLTPGTYRVRLDISGTDFYAEFDMEDADTHIEMYEESGAEDLVIDEILDDRFVCSSIIPLPMSYEVLCDTSEYSEYCVGDHIEVWYFKFCYDPDNSDVICLYPESIGPSDFELDPDVDYKPVIYLYPEKETDVRVRLDYNGTLTFTEPEYSDGWTVTAYPDGTLISAGRKYHYLFWEGRRNYELDTSAGFCVSGEETEAFLAEKLAYLGLNEKETADFMEFWLPYMNSDPYNVITFAGTDYTDNAVLGISPAPDTVIRVFMVFSPSDTFVDIPAQTLAKAPDRHGFTAVEWGGAIK